MENNEIMNNYEEFDVIESSEENAVVPAEKSGIGTAGAFVLGGATVIVGGKILKFLHKKVVKPIVNKIKRSTHKEEDLIEAEYEEIENEDV